MTNRDIDQLPLASEPPPSYPEEVSPKQSTAVESLVQRSAEGDVAAWRQLQEAIQTDITTIARGHRELRRKGLANHPDHLAEITVATFERLSNRGFANLKSFLKHREEAELDTKARFDLWLWKAVNYATLAHIRAVFGRAPSQQARDQAGRPLPSKVDVQSRAGRLDDEPERGFLHTLGMTARLTSGEIFAWMQREFSAQEVRAMHLYYVEERDFEEIAGELQLADAKAADATIRKLNARLRYHFSKT